MYFDQFPLRLFQRWTAAQRLLERFFAPPPTPNHPDFSTFGRIEYFRSEWFTPSHIEKFVSGGTLALPPSPQSIFRA